jgi:hypothetical protein
VTPCRCGRSGGGPSSPPRPRQDVPVVRVEVGTQARSGTAEVREALVVVDAREDRGATARDLLDEVVGQRELARREDRDIAEALELDGPRRRRDLGEDCLVRRVEQVAGVLQREPLVGAQPAGDRDRDDRGGDAGPPEAANRAGDERGDADRDEQDADRRDGQEVAILAVGAVGARDRVVKNFPLLCLGYYLLFDERRR